MIKKIIFLLSLTLLVMGCTGGETGLNPNQVVVDPPIVPAIDPTNTDENLLVYIVSTPAATDAPRTVEFQYRADQIDNLEEDFVYSYKLEQNGTVIKSEDYVTYTAIKFTELIANSQCSFKIKAHNKKTGKTSQIEQSYEFRVTNSSEIDPFVENIELTVKLDKSTIKAGEDLVMTFNMRNKSDEAYEFLPSTNLDTRDKWTLTDDGSPNKIEAGEIIEFTRTYNLKEYENLLIISSQVEDLDSGSIKIASGKTIKIPDTEDMSVDLKKVEIRSSVAEIFPGEIGIKIYYTVKNNVNSTVTIKDIVARFYDLEGNDLTEYFTDTTTDTKTLPAKAELSVYHIYNVGAVPAGNLFVDATVTISYEGEEASDNSSDEIGKIKVVDKGKGILKAWIAYPEGAVDGVVSLGQDFTVYAKIDYDGNADYNYDGEISIDDDALDGMRIAVGSQTTTFNLNQQVQWTMRAGTIPISGNLRVYIKTPPNDSSEDIDLEFETEEVLISMQTVDEAELDIETGIETDDYGAKDGMIKAGTELAVYATVFNKSVTEASGTVRMRLRESTMGGFKIVAGETLVKEVEVGAKATWILKAPTTKEVSNIEIEFLNLPEDPNSNVELTISLNSGDNIRVQSLQAADIQLKNVTVLQEEAEPGEDSIPIVFDIQNIGGVDIKVESLKANFTQNGVDVSEKWILSEINVNNNSIIAPGETRGITAYYRLMNNIFDGTDLVGEVTIAGEVTVSDIETGEEITDLQPKVIDSIRIRDRVAPVSVAGEDITAAVGDVITLDGSGSTDNVGITSWSWIIYTERGTSMLSTALTGETRLYTIGSDFTAGTYRVELKVNDAERNGTVSDTLILTIE